MTLLIFPYPKREEEETKEPFDAESIEKVVLSVAKALDYLHNDHHLLHGDMKSGNVLVIGDFAEVKICDFGVTCPLDDDLKVTDQGAEYIGTGPWMAKEAINKDMTVSNKTDIFALGISEAFNGTPGFYSLQRSLTCLYCLRSILVKQASRMGPINLLYRQKWLQLFL